MTYDEWFEEMQRNMHNRESLGRAYMEALPQEIADVIAGSFLDPYYYDFITPQCHERVRRIWERR